MSDPLDLTPKLGDLAFTRPGDRGTEMAATFAGALSFMRRRYTRDLSGVDVAVWGIPLDLAVTNRPGTRFGPRGVRAASAHMAWSGPWPWDFDPYDELAVIDYGDCLFDPGRPTEIAGRIVEQATAILASGDNPCYITLDIDCLDPSAAPGTGTPVPGGLTSYQAQEILRNLAGVNVVGMDVVEVSPPFDHAEITALAGATVANDLIALHAIARRNI